MPDTPPPPATLSRIAGTVLCRAIVPLWILTGATFKLIESNPGLLPREMLGDANRLGIDLDVLLASLISLEFLAVLVIALLGRVSRVAAGFMLACFCAVLVREVAAGNASCGCLGAHSPSPWAMLAIDGAMLVGVLTLRPIRFRRMDNSFWPPITVGVLFVIAAAFTFVRVVPPEATGLPHPTPVPAPPAADEALDDSAPADEITLPSYWFSSDFDAWIGKRWDEIDLLRFMRTPPTGLEQGTRYVVFYSRTCDHCEEMFREDLAPNPDLARQVTAVEVPAETDIMTSPGAWVMPATEVELLALPLGTNWIITTPLALRVEDGVIRCAEEGEHRTCLGLE